MKKMELQRWLLKGTAFGFALLACGAWAQDAAPAKEDTQDSEEDEVVVPIHWNELTLGYWATPSNHFLRRYGQPPRYSVIQKLQLLNPADEGKVWARFLYAGQFNGDNYSSGRVVSTDGHTAVTGSRIDSTSYIEDWQRPGPSSLINTEVVLDHDFSTSFGGYFLLNQFAMNSVYPAPREADQTKNEVVAVGLSGGALGGQVSVDVASRRTSDKNLLVPTSQQRRYTLSYSHDVGDAINLEGSASYAGIEQRGLQMSTVRSYSLGGSWYTTPNTALQFQLARQDFDLPNLQGPAIRKRLLTSAKLIQRVAGWSLQFGMKHREIERYRTDHSFVDVPKWDIYEGRLAGRIGGLRQTFKGSWENLLANAQMQTEDPRQLQWDDRATFQSKTELGNDTYSLYSVYTLRWQQNRQRAVDINWDNLTVGGSLFLNSSLNAFAEGSFDAFRTSGDVGTSEPLDFYFPAQRTATVGLNWAAGAAMSASAGLNYYESGDVHGSQLTLSLHRQLAKDHELGLVVAPWRQHDRLYDITNYRTTVASLQYSVRF